MTPQQEYYIDSLPNIQDTPFSAGQLRAVIEQRTPCGSFGVIQREPGACAQTRGSGRYIKRADAARSIAVVSEQGTCLGLMAALFPERAVRADAAARLG
jgi:hypothetical protein